MKDSLTNVVEALKPLAVTAAAGGFTIADLNSILGTVATCLSLIYATVKLIKDNKKPKKQKNESN